MSKTVTLYVTSTETFAGKSAVCIALGERLRADGFDLGYMKPVSTAGRKLDEQMVDEDAAFVKRLWNLPEPMAVLAPATLTPDTVEAILTGDLQDVAEKVERAFATVARDRDVVLLDGAGDLGEGGVVGLSPREAASRLGAHVLVVTRYSDDPSAGTGSRLVTDNLLLARHILGDRMIGAVVNVVPRQRLAFVQNRVVPYLERHQVRVLGVLPRDQVLQSVTVGELAEGLGGEILNCPERADELVENLMVGAMGVDNALQYFRRKANKAVITGGDRPDIQLAALETSTTCLILTGNFRPNPIILGRAEELGVPMILARQDTLTAVEMAGTLFGRARFQQEKKLYRFKRLFEEAFNFEALYEAVGLSKT